MSRFARTPEEAFLRHKELAEKIDEKGKPKVDKDGKPLPAKGALQTLYLYQLILMHSWGNGFLDKKFSDLCELYGLEYHNSTRRLKTLRNKGWIEQTAKGIRPLLIHREKNSKGVKITPEPDQSVNSTPETSVKITPPSVKITPEKCKNYTENGEKSVKITPENPATPNEISDSGDAKTLLNLKSDLETTTTTNNSSKKELSRFEIEDCIRWIQKRIENGEKIETPHKLARWAHQSGEMDAFIQATLYPEVSEIPELTYSHLEIDGDGFSEAQMKEHLVVLRDIIEIGDDVRELKHFYTPDDWARLMKELANVEKQ